MKKIKFLLLILAVVLFTACNETNDECPTNPLNDGNEAIISATIGSLKTRATDKSWDAGDAIGIYALNAGEALADASIHDNYTNVKYTTTGSSTFTPASTKIEFPEQGNLDFVSYYPYQQTVNDYSIGVDVTSQSNPASIDLLYADNAKGNNSSNANVALVFEHMLSKLVLNVSTGKGLSSLQGLTSKLEGVIVNGNLNLVNGNVTLGNTKKAITPLISIANDNQSAVITAIVIPGQDLKDVKIEFTLNGKSFKWTPNAQLLNSTTKYTYPVKLAIDGSGTSVVADITGTIEDWKEGNAGGSTITLLPNQNPVFTSNSTSIAFEANSNLSQEFKLTTQDTQAWTASSDASWLSATPANGTGNADITAKAQENTTTAERNATITLTPTGNSSLSPITISVTQKGKGTTPATGNDGSEANPYTVAEAIANQDNGADVWVKAFIVGSSNNGGTYTPQFSNNDPSGTNIIIADSKDETNGAMVIPVQLVSGGDARNDLNLLANSGMYKAEVLLKGNLEKYFGQPGLKGVSEYKLITAGDGGSNPNPNPNPNPTPTTGDILDEPFDGTLGSFSEYSVSGSNVWQGSDHNGDTFAKMTGYNDGPNEDWLISPAIDLSSVTSANLSFSHAIGYQGNMYSEETVWISTDYTSGNPNSATWTEISINYPPEKPFWTWVDVSVTLPTSAIGKSNVHIAFKYTSGQKASTWEIKNVLVK